MNFAATWQANLEFLVRLEGRWSLTKQNKREATLYAASLPKTSFPSNMIGLYLYLLEISGNHQDSSTPEVRMPSSFTSSPGPRPCRPSWSLASEHQYAQGQCQWRLHTPVDWDTFNHLFSRGFSGFKQTPRKTFVESVHSTSSYPNQENRKRSASQSRTARTTLSNMFREQCIHCGVQGIKRWPQAEPSV